MLTIGICDDDSVHRENAERLLAQWIAARGIPAKICTYADGAALVAAHTDLRHDILLLDIVMPQTNGMQVAKLLRQTDAALQIIFLTASPDYALDSYAVHAWDYLLKPLSYERLAACMDACTATLTQLPDCLLCKTAFGHQRLFFRDIEYAEAQNKRVIFALTSGIQVEAHEPLHTFSEHLTEKNGFFKCHRSYIVYLPNVSRFSHAQIVMQSGKTVPIARGNAPAFKEAYFSFLFAGKEAHDADFSS